MGANHLAGKESVVLSLKAGWVLSALGDDPPAPQAERKSAPNVVGRARRGHTFRHFRSQKRDRFLAPESVPFLVSPSFSEGRVLKP